MIITITGKPCSGKGTISKIICEKENFEYICTGDMFRQVGEELGFKNILDYQKDEKVKLMDKIVDDKTVEIGKTRLKDNIVFDSRLAWHFIPNSFKVFVDVSWEEAGRRLLGANRQNEQAKDINEATQALKERWNVENKRYLELYNVNNLDQSQYDLVVSSNNKSPNEVAETIIKKYKEFIKSL